MARDGVTYKEVVTVIERLKKQAIHPTIDGIRQCLGNTGSNTTIARHLRMYHDLSAKPIKKTLDYYEGYNDCRKDILNLIKKQETWK